MKSIVLSVLAVAACAVAYPNPNYGDAYDGSNMNLYSSYDNGPRASLVEDPEYDPNTGIAPQNDPIANFNPFAYPPLATFIERMQDTMRKVQMQMGEVLSRMPPQDIDWSKLGNSTSHTKIVNDHVVTINETTYKNPNDALGSVLHIRVVNVKPTPSPDSTNPTTYVGDNDKRRTNRASIVRQYFPNGQIMKRQYPRDFTNLNPIVLDNIDNSVDVFQPAQPNDLSRDTLVNNLRRDQTKSGLVMVDPNAELIDVVDGQVRPSFHYRQPRNDFNHQQRIQPVFNWNGPNGNN